MPSKVPRTSSHEPSPRAKPDGDGPCSTRLALGTCSWGCPLEPKASYHWGLGLPGLLEVCFRKHRGGSWEALYSRAGPSSPTILHQKLEGKCESEHCMDLVFSVVHAIKTGQEQGMDRKRMYGKVVGKEGLLVKMEMAVSLSKHLKTLEPK